MPIHIIIYINTSTYVIFFREMMLGQVNSVGQYVSALDPEPDEDKKKRGKLCCDQITIIIG